MSDDGQRFNVYITGLGNRLVVQAFDVPEELARELVWEATRRNTDEADHNRERWSTTTEVRPA